MSTEGMPPTFPGSPPTPPPPPPPGAFLVWPGTGVAPALARPVKRRPQTKPPRKPINTKPIRG